MRGRYWYLLFFVLTLLLSSITHSVRAEFKKGKNDTQKQLVIIKAPTDALHTFSVPDFSDPVVFSWLSLPSFVVNQIVYKPSEAPRSILLDVLFSRIAPSQAP
jgi:hypothetical protein